MKLDYQQVMTIAGAAAMSAISEGYGVRTGPTDADGSQIIRVDPKGMLVMLLGMFGAEGLEELCDIANVRCPAPACGHPKRCMGAAYALLLEHEAWNKKIIEQANAHLAIGRSTPSAATGKDPKNETPN